MLDMNAIKISKNKFAYNRKLYYKIGDHKYCMSTRSIDASKKLLHMEFGISYFRTGTSRTYSMDKGGLTIPPKHMKIAEEMMELFEDLILIPARLTNEGSYRIYNFYSELFKRG